MSAPVTRPAPDLSVVVVSYRTRELLRESLASIAPGAAGLRCEVIVVDNGSDDGSAEMVRESWPGARLIVNLENRGYAPACNQGLRASRARYVLALNSDAFPRPGALAALVRYLESHPGHGAAGPRLLNSDGTTQRACARREPSFLASLLGSTHLPAYASWLLPFVSRLYPHGWYQRPGEPEVLSGACILYRRQVLERAGLLDERLVLNYDDVEWSIRARRGGACLAYVPAAEVVHLGSQSRVIDRVTSRRGDLCSTFVFWDLLFPAPLAVVLKLSVIASVALSLAKNLVLAPFGRERRRRARACASVLSHGLALLLRAAGSGSAGVRGAA